MREIWRGATPSRPKMRQGATPSRPEMMEICNADD